MVKDHQFHKLFWGRFDVFELLHESTDDEEYVEDIMAIALHRIAKVVSKATERRRGKVRNTDNYIIGVEGKIGDLANYVYRKMDRNFLVAEDLGIDGIEDKYIVEQIIKHAEHKIISTCLVDIRDNGDLWLEEGLGIWQFSQRMVDLHRRLDRTAIRRKKVDRRNFHGRPRQQTKRRGAPPTSIGSCRDSQVI